jgi:hypothetical protein
VRKRLTKDKTKDKLAYIRGANDMKNDIKIVNNKILRGWFVVRGPHQTPIGGRFDTKEEAQASLKRPNGIYIKSINH